MNMQNGTPAEFLHDIEGIEEMKKEFILTLDQNNKIFLSIFYKKYQFPSEVFNIYFSNPNDFLTYKKNLQKESNYEIVITETLWSLSGSELKPYPGKKRFVKCKIIDIRNDFFKVKILPDII